MIGQLYRQGLLSQKVYKKFLVMWETVNGKTNL